jgi:hypothetical protein
MKVLLILTSTHLWCSAGRALMLWSITCFTGCLLLYGIGYLVVPPVQAIVLSHIFSSPAVFIAVLLFYHLYRLPTPFLRTLFSMCTILLTSAGIIALVSVVFRLHYFEVAEALLPFIPGALLFFFIIAYKQLSRSYPV